MHQAEKIIDKANMIQINEESKLPSDIIKLSASYSVDSAKTPTETSEKPSQHEQKRREEHLQRQQNL